MIINNKNGLTVIVAMTLLLLLSSVTGVIIYQWSTSLQSEWNTKNELKGDSGKLKIMYISRYDVNETIVGVKNLGNSYHIISQVDLDGSECPLLTTNVVDDLDLLYLNCTVRVDSTYRIEVFSDKGSYTTTLTVFE